MVDKVGIINGAIGLVGGDRISAIPAEINSTTVHKNARWALTLYDDAVGAVLEQWPFNDVRGRYVLEQHGDAPAFEYDAQYALNPKTLKVIGVRGCNSRWVREGRMILASGIAESIEVLTIDRVPEGQLSSLVARAISAQLAEDIAVAISESQPKLDGLSKKARDRLLMACQADNWEASAQDLISSGWMLAAQTSYAPERMSAWLDE